VKRVIEARNLLPATFAAAAITDFAAGGEGVGGEQQEQWELPQLLLRAAGAAGAAKGFEKLGI